MNQLGFTNPFAQAGEAINYYHDDILNHGLDTVNDSLILQPLDYVGRQALGYIYGGLRAALDTSDMKLGPGNAPEPINKTSTVGMPPKGKNATKNFKKREKKRQEKKKGGGKPPPRRQEPRTRGPFRKARGGRGGPESKIMSPAVAYGTRVPGAYYKFSAARNSNCVRMQVRYYLGVIQLSALGVTQFSINRLGGGAFNNGGQWYLNPANTAYFSDCPFATMMGLFQKYYLNGVKLIGFTKVGTSTNGTLTVGSMDDPTYFESSGTATAVSNPTKKIITEMYGSATIPIWAASWVLPFKYDPKQMYYMRSQSGTSTAYSYADPSAASRQAYSHCAGFLLDGVELPIITTDVCDVYIEIDIEACDLSSVFTNAPAISLNDRIKKLELMFGDESDTDKKNI